MRTHRIVGLHMRRKVCTTGVGRRHAWLVTAFSPARVQAAIEALAGPAGRQENPAVAQVRKRLAACDRRLGGCRAVLDAGADAVQVAAWINETERERARLEGEQRATPVDRVPARDGMAELLCRTGELAQAVVGADPDDKAELYRKLGLRMTYFPQKQLVEARVIPASTCANDVCPRGDLNPHAP